MVKVGKIKIVCIGDIIDTTTFFEDDGGLDENQSYQIQTAFKDFITTIMKDKITLLTYDKNNNLLFKVRSYSALFLIDFSNERIKLLKGYMPKSKKKKLCKFMYEHYDLTF